VSVEFGQYCFWVLALYGGDVIQISEEEVVDVVGHVEGADDPLIAQTCVDVLVGVAADVEVARHFFHCEIAT
jgi:hypothetical protein